MQTLTMLGSPRPKGNTAWVLDRMAEVLRKDGGDVVLRTLRDEALGPCLDCRACFTGERVCPVADDMMALDGELTAADLIVFASPIYWSGITGPMKKMVDRLRPYYRNGRLRGKKCLVVSVGGNPEENDLIDAQYRRVCGALGLELLGHLSLKAYDVGDLARSGFDAREALVGMGLCGGGLTKSGRGGEMQPSEQQPLPIRAGEA